MLIYSKIYFFYFYVVVKSCEKLIFFVNGYVRIFCLRIFKGKCFFMCCLEFFLNGSKIFLCFVNFKWELIFGLCEGKGIVYDCKFEI